MPLHPHTPITLHRYTPYTSELMPYMLYTLQTSPLLAEILECCTFRQYLWVGRPRGLVGAARTSAAPPWATAAAAAAAAGPEVQERGSERGGGEKIDWERA